MSDGLPVVVGVSGSRREGSYTRVGVAHALRAAAAAGAETELIDLRRWDLPAYDPDADGGVRVAVFADRLRRADAIILGSPVYHGSYASTLKTALDWVGSDEFEDATVGLLTVAGGSAYATTLEHMRQVVRHVHGWVLPHQVAIPHAWDAVEDGEIVDEEIAERTTELGREAVRYARIDPTDLPVEAGVAAGDHGIDESPDDGDRTDQPTAGGEGGAAPADGDCAPEATDD